MKHFELLFALLLALLGGEALMAADAPSNAAQAMFPFVIPWDDASESVANVSAWNEKPAGKHGFVRVRNGHFVDGRGKRLRFFGTNLCFAGAFPPHEVAEKAAARMAKFGINIVRFHHMDSRAFPNGILDGAYDDKQHLSPEALDRLDYLIHQLKRNGIYANINLHVSRKLGEADGIEHADEMPRMDKGVDNFHPRMIELQRKYARDLLAHVNAYTGNAYADEPAVAMIELNNENSLTTLWRRGELDALPQYCQEMLDARWHEWLRGRYGDTDAIREAWSDGAAPLGGEMLRNGQFVDGLQGWALEVHESASATAESVRDGPAGNAGLKVTIAQPSETGWYVQLHQAGLDFDEGAPYMLSFWARAEPERRISVNTFATREPWHSLGFSASAAVESEWQRYSFSFRPNETYAGGRVGFSDLAKVRGTLWLADVSLRPGGVDGLRDGETLAARTIARPRRSEMAGWSRPLQRDYVRFLLDVAREYWTGMAEYLRSELGVESLITGTQMGYTPIQTHVAMDYFDAHAYWHHPSFPGRPWDSNNWWVRNVSMVTAKGGTLPGLAARRVAGYPYTISEYNHPAPNTYCSEAYLLLAAYGALQDWDGIFSFAYCHNDQWDVRRIPSYFDIKSHPTKLVTLPAAAALFRRPDVRASRRRTVVTANAPATVEHGLDNPARGSYVTTYGVPLEAALRRRMAIRLGKGPLQVKGSVPDPSEAALYVSDGGQLTWDCRDPQQACVLVDTPNSKAAIGFCDGRTFELGEVTISLGSTLQGWAAITATAVDGTGFARPGRILVTATGRAENTGWGWEQEGERVTLRRNWGEEPSLVEGISATIRLPVRPGRVEAHVLDERGQRREPLVIGDSDDRALVTIGPEHHTLWYEIIIRPRR